MLEVQKYLQSQSLESLSDEFAIKQTHHLELPLVILNYDTIESKPRNHEIVRECRALVLNKNDFSIAARSMRRFFNWGEYQDEMDLFEWRGCEAQSKEDGSLFMLYNYLGKWMVSTRGSFATDKLQFCPYTWREIFEIAIGSKLEEISLDPKLTYVFELVSPYNKVVRTYKEPAVYLLSVFDADRELTSDECDYIVRKHKDHRMLRPATYRFGHIEEVKDYLYEVAKEDATFEGVVVKNKGQRWKIKSPTYLSLHQMGSIKENLFNPKYQIDFMLAGEEDEVLTYFPEIKNNYFNNKAVVEQAYNDLKAVWHNCWQIKDRKTFAQTVVPKTKFAGILFTLRDRYGDHQNEEVLRKEWRDSKKLILKNLF